MNTELRAQIYHNMDGRETEDLLAIWQTNDRVEWSDEAFEVVADVLRSRGVELPQQDEPVLEHAEEAADDSYGLTEEELKIVDDENPPDFYGPVEVLDLGRWLNVAALAAIVLAVLEGFTEFPAYYSTARSFFMGTPGSGLVATTLAVLLLCIRVAFQVVITYLPLRVLAHILRILMQMEFNSRHPRQAPD